MNNKVYIAVLWTVINLLLYSLLNDKSDPPGEFIYYVYKIALEVSMIMMLLVAAGFVKVDTK